MNIQSDWIENKDLKDKVIELKPELSKSFLEVSENLTEENWSLILILVCIDQCNIPPFMNLLKKTTEVYKMFLSRYLVPSNTDAILPIIGSTVVVNVG